MAAADRSQQAQSECSAAKPSRRQPRLGSPTFGALAVPVCGAVDSSSYGITTSVKERKGKCIGINGTRRIGLGEDTTQRQSCCGIGAAAAHNTHSLNYNALEGPVCPEVIVPAKW